MDQLLPLHTYIPKPFQKITIAFDNAFDTAPILKGTIRSVPENEKQNRILLTEKCRQLMVEFNIKIQRFHESRND